MKSGDSGHCSPKTFTSGGWHAQNDVIGVSVGTEQPRRSGISNMPNNDPGQFENKGMSYPIWKKLIGTYGFGGAVVLFFVGHLFKRSDVSAYAFEFGMFCLVLSAHKGTCPHCKRNTIFMLGAHPEHCSRCGGAIKNPSK